MFESPRVSSVAFLFVYQFLTLGKFDMPTPAENYVPIVYTPYILHIIIRYR